MSRNFLSRARSLSMVAITASAVLLQVSPGLGQAPRGKERRSCAAAYEKAQELRQASKLRKSREALIGCSRSACGDFVQRECAKWLTQVDTEMPSIVLVAKDDLGLPVVDVEVSLDGEELTSQMDGRAVPVDPGIHDFVFKTGSGATIARRIAIAQGERNRLISIDVPVTRQGSVSPAALQPKALPVAMGAAASAPSAKAKAVPAPLVAGAPIAASTRTTVVAAPVVSATPVTASRAAPTAAPSDAAIPATSEGGGFASVAPYLVGSVGVLGLGGYALLYGIAKSDNNTLSECWPDCSEGRLNRIRHTYLAADISLGVGAAALGTATYLFLSRPSNREKPPATAASYVVDVSPSRSGVFASVSGIF